MGFWSFYFFAKLLMFCAGFIGFHVLENLGFALLVALPARHWLLRTAKLVVTLPLGLALLYYDSWLPPWRRLFAQGNQMSDFSPIYLLELAQRFINLKLVLALLLMLAIHWLLSRKLRMSTFAFLGILAAPWLGVLAGVSAPSAPAPLGGATTAAAGAAPAISSAQELDTALDVFYSRERQRRLRFSPAEAQSPPFDILVLQVCSLAWDDLDFAGQRQHPLLSRFDLRLNNFSAAASYSGPAAIRLLRSGCGQPPHETLYQDVDPACHLYDGLQSAGFVTQWAMNHDGVFGGMLADITERGGLKATLFPLDGLKPALRAFDGSPYYSDYEVLSAWWQQRQKLGVPRVALYYNTGTLHDGNRFLDGSHPGVQDSYRRRAGQLFEDLGRFFDLIQSSGRRAVVVMVPEHGANARGDRLQISGLREIPTPAIALVPVGVKLVGREAQVAVQLDTPFSHFGLGSLLTSFITANPYLPGAQGMADYARNLPQTEYVAENDGTVVMRAGGRYWLRGADRQWSEYQAGR